MEELIQSARNCTICAAQLPHAPRPVFVVHPAARILIIGQAPGRKVHESGIPWDDASGKRLGFCFPGTGKSGDLPPRPECAPQWHEPLLRLMPNIELTLLFGQYAMQHYLGDRRRKNLTETVRNWQDYQDNFLPLPHPSPRNQLWVRKNPWFEAEVLPYLQQRVAALLAI